MDATEFWIDRFGEKPQTDTENLAVAMMSDYRNHCFVEYFKILNKHTKGIGQYMDNEQYIDNKMVHK